MCDSLKLSWRNHVCACLKLSWRNHVCACLKLSWRNHVWRCSEHVENDFLTPFRTEIHVSMVWHWGKCLKTNIWSLLRFPKRIWKNARFGRILLYKMTIFFTQNPNFTKKQHNCRSFSNFYPNFKVDCYYHNYPTIKIVF